MTIEDRLEQRASRVPQEDPRTVLDAARAEAEQAMPGSRRPQPRYLAVAAAAVVVVAALTAGGLAVLTDDGDDPATVVGPDEDESVVGPDGDESTTAPELPPRSGEECDGLRSEMVWAHTGTTEAITAPAGGTASYEETVTNDGGEACAIVWQTCPAPGVLFTADGERVPEDMVVCAAIAYPPEDLAPGESRTEPWTTPLSHEPGTYELRVAQRDRGTSLWPGRLGPGYRYCLS